MLVALSTERTTVGFSESVSEPERLDLASTVHSCSVEEMEEVVYCGRV